MTLFIAIMQMLFIHWLADFYAQTDHDAKNKSSSNTALFSHTSTYSLIWFVFMWAQSSSLILALIFAFITFVCHSLQDYITSRIVKRYFDKKDYHNGFIIIGLDQMLHYAQLMLTFGLLFT